MKEVLGSAAAGLGLVAVVMGHVGWFAPPRAWGEATGWSTIPVEERPSFDLAWPDDAGEAPAVHWLGHSGFLIVWHGVRLLLDPNTSPRVILGPRILEAAAPASMLGTVDAVLVSHAHYDHLDLPTIAALPSVRRILVPVGSETYLHGARSDARVVGLNVWETERIGPVEVVAVPPPTMAAGSTRFRADTLPWAGCSARGAAQSTMPGTRDSGTTLRRLRGPPESISRFCRSGPTRLRFRCDVTT